MDETVSSYREYVNLLRERLQRGHTFTRENINSAAKRKKDMYDEKSVLNSLFVCLFGIASPQVGLPGPSDFVDRSITPGKDQCIS